MKTRRLTKYKRIVTEIKPVRVKFRTKTGKLVSFRAKKVVRKRRK
jgi:hypothetical protein